MRIGIDCRLWNETGIGRYTRNLVLNLQKTDKKNEYTLFILNKDKKEILKQVQNDNFKMIEADIRWHTIREQLKLPKILNKENLDLVHFPYFSVPIFYNRPFVITIHDLIIDHFSTGEASTLFFPLYRLKLAAYRFVRLQAARRSEKIITVSESTKNEIVKHLNIDQNKVDVFYEGVDPGINKSELNSQRELKDFDLESKNYFLYVGNAYPHKNLMRLIEAFKQIKIQTQDLKLVMVGKQDYFYERLKKKVKILGLSDSIVFTEQIRDISLSYLYRNALATVVPSLMEGFGLSAIEAMANNCLVLASGIESLKEICEEIPIYFNPTSVSDIKNKLLLAYSDELKDRQKRITAGISLSKKFSWRKMAQKTLSVYRENC